MTFAHRDLERNVGHRTQHFGRIGKATASQITVQGFFLFFFLIFGFESVGEKKKNNIAFKPTDMHCLLNSPGNNMYARIPSLWMGDIYNTT